MKVKTRLLLLNSINIVFAFIAILAYFIVMNSLSKLDEEKIYFNDLLYTSMDLQLQMNRLSIEAFGDQLPKYEASRKAFNDSVEALNNIQYITALDESMASAVSSLKAIRSLANTGLDDLEKILQDILADAKEVQGSTTNSTVLSVLDQARTNKVDNLTLINYHTILFQRSLTEQQMSMEAIVKKIKETDGAINADISRVQNSTQIITLIAILIIMGITGILTFLVVRSIIYALNSMKSLVEQMSNGDLRGRFESNKKDELASLGNNLNLLLGMLHQSLGKTSNIAQENLRMKDDLINAVEQSMSSVTEIEANASSIGSQMKTLDAMVNEEGKEIQHIAEGLALFNTKAAVQKDHVDESASAVTQMLASIQNISRIAENDQESASILVEEADRGREIFEDSFNKINDIGNQVGLIQDMATVIANIATQTNILAMNAAIEAAHAGDAGRGFAVVADEISKLATAAAESSDEIAQSIRSIINQVDDAVSAKDLTSQTFDTIASRIKLVAESIAEIHSNIKEMQLGSEQILEAMEGLRLDSSQISEESSRIDLAAHNMADSFAKVTRISHEVSSNIGEISTGLGEISKTVSEVDNNANRVGDLGKDLVGSVSIFHLNDGRKEDLYSSDEEVPEAEELDLEQNPE